MNSFFTFCVVAGYTEMLKEIQCTMRMNLFDSKLAFGLDGYAKL